MRCPKCQSQVDVVRAGLDARNLRVCSNAKCDWERLPAVLMPHGHSEWIHPVRAEELRYHGVSVF